MPRLGHPAIGATTLHESSATHLILDEKNIGEK